MPAPIYLGQDPSTIGNIIAPAAQQTTQFLWNILGQRMKQKFLMEQAELQAQRQSEQDELAFERRKKLAKYKESIKPKTQPSLIKQYEYAVGQGYSGTFTEWKKNQAEAGAPRITIGEKLSLQEGKNQLSLEKSVRQPGFRNQVISGLRGRFGTDWDDMDDYTKDELTWREMHERIKAVYPDAYFDHKASGWYGLKSGKIIRKYTGTPMRLRGLTPSRPGGQYR